LCHAEKQTCRNLTTRHDTRHKIPHRYHQRESRRKLNGASPDLAGN
ncbi:unnamed protein product, partial [Brassica oleracea var. botrytis]